MYTCPIPASRRSYKTVSLCPRKGWNGWVTSRELQELLLASAVCESRLDDPGGDGPALAQCGGVVQVAGLVVQVAGALVGSGALGGRVAAGGSAAADPGRDLAGAAVQDLAGLAGDP